MKLFITGVILLCCLALGESALAWDGFDADSADLVEIIPDSVPAIGDTITVKNHDADTSESCFVESVKRNKRTIEVVVAYPDGKARTLVMEGR